MQEQLIKKCKKKLNIWKSFVSFSQELYKSFEEKKGEFQFASATNSRELDEMQKFLDEAVEHRWTFQSCLWLSKLSILTLSLLKSSLGFLHPRGRRNLPPVIILWLKRGSILFAVIVRPLSCCQCQIVFKVRLRQIVFKMSLRKEVVVAHSFSFGLLIAKFQLRGAHCEDFGFRGYLRTDEEVQ